MSVVIALMAPVPLAAQDRAENRAPEIRTHATATRTVRADLATVSLDFNAVGHTPAEAGARVAALADSLRRALQGLGIPRDSLTSGSQWHWWRGRMEVVLGHQHVIVRPNQHSLVEQDTAYRAHDALQVRVRDLRLVGPIIDTAFAYGVTQVGGVRFEATKTTEAREAAIREATAMVRRQATALADAGGVRLGRVRALTTEGGGDARYWFDARATSAGSSTGTQVIEPSIAVSATVYGTWDIAERP